MPSRRRFLSLVPLLGAASVARAQPPLLDPKDPAALAQGYVADAAGVDKTKFPKYAGGQACANCALYQGSADAAAGPCPIYAGKRVAARGWCNVYVKRP